MIGEPFFARKPKEELPLFERAVVAVEEKIKGRLFGCEMCGQCILSNTGYVCPMGCPKGLRNGPCGGTLDGRCEVHPEMKCVWVNIYDHRKTKDYLEKLPPLQAPVKPHLAGTSSYLNLLLGKDRETRVPVPYLDLEKEPRTAPTTTESKLEERLKTGGFALTAEIHSPKTRDALGRVTEDAEALVPFVDAVNATSNAGGRPTVSGLDSARHIAEAGADPILQVCGRDVDADMFLDQLETGSSNGSHNVLCLTGDWAGEIQARAKRQTSWSTFFPMDSAQMIYEARALRELGKSLLTHKIYPSGKEPRHFIGGVINPYSTPRSTVIARLAQKAACGVDFIQTQAVLDPKEFLSWLGEVRETGLLGRFFLLPSVPLILSTRSLEICAGLPGVHVPHSVRERLYGAADPSGRCEKAGFELAEEICTQLYRATGVDGIHLMIFGGRWKDVAGWVGELRRQTQGAPRPAAKTLA